MLKNSFFSLRPAEKTDAAASDPVLKFILTLNSEHPIYKGHFPGNPVVPGVCQIRMIHEVLEEQLQVPLRLTAADQIKFLRMIDPRNDPELEVDLRIRRTETLEVDVNATIMAGPVIFLKFKGHFSPTP